MFGPLEKVFGTSDKVFGRSENVFGTSERVLGPLERAFGPLKKVLGRSEKVFRKFEEVFGRSEKVSEASEPFFEKAMKGKEIGEQVSSLPLRPWGLAFGRFPWDLELGIWCSAFERGLFVASGQPAADRSQTFGREKAQKATKTAGLNRSIRRRPRICAICEICGSIPAYSNRRLLRYPGCERRLNPHPCNPCNPWST